MTLQDGITKQQVQSPVHRPYRVSRQSTLAVFC